MWEGTAFSGYLRDIQTFAAEVVAELRLFTGTTSFLALFRTSEDDSF